MELPVRRFVKTNDCSDGLSGAARQAVLLGHRELLIRREVLHLLARKHSLELRDERTGRRPRVSAVRIRRVRVLDHRQCFIRVDQAARVWHVAGRLRVDVERDDRPARVVVE